MYYTVRGGVPTVADVERAIEDLEKMYVACGIVTRLADAKYMGICDAPGTVAAPPTFSFGMPANLNPSFPK